MKLPNPEGLIAFLCLPKSVFCLFLDKVEKQHLHCQMKPCMRGKKTYTSERRDKGKKR